MSEASVSSVSICAEQNARPTDQPASDQATDQSAVNRAILMSLDRLNDNFTCFSQQYDDELVDSELVLLEEQADNPVNLDIQADIDSLIQPCEHSVDHTGVLNTTANANETDILQYDKQLDLNLDVQGPPINEKISNVVDKLRLQRISQDQAKAIMKRHNTPENVQLRLPKCEPTIWNEIPGKARSTDMKFQTTQAALLGAINCQLDVANSLLSANVSKDVLTSCLDGITLAMTANFDLTQRRRRDAIRPHFKYEFAKGLCSSTSPADEFLFGGDTAKRLKKWPSSLNTKFVKADLRAFAVVLSDSIRIPSEGHEEFHPVLEAIVVTFFNQVSNSVRIFPMRPSPSEKPASRSHLAIGMLIYYMILDHLFLTNHRLLRVTLRILFLNGRNLLPILRSLIMYNTVISNLLMTLLYTANTGLVSLMWNNRIILV